ncbi:MAG: hypothetical protein JST54_08990 [Deltaproteobacteria bacterium]|nr:hypothetical protein [Deltaproteobacteria bacterium]
MSVRWWTLAACAAALGLVGCNSGTRDVLAGSSDPPGSSASTGSSGTTGAATIGGSASTTGAGASSSSSGSTGSSASSASSSSSSTGSSGSSGSTGSGQLHATAVHGPASNWQIIEIGGNVYDVSSDKAGNLWVADGVSGLVYIPAGSATPRWFTLADGLHPYGYPSQGAITQVQLKVISVAGGEANNAYVGYDGIGDCEDEWDQDQPNPDPNIYKSGDADHVWISGGGFNVAHYDIYTGPGIVAAEPQGREKLCSIYRLVYDGAHGAVWAGANHGFAFLNPNYDGSSFYLGDDDPGILMEHIHPAINGYLTDASPATDDFLLTGGYYGMAVDPAGDIWAGGIFRTYKCVAGEGGINFWTCESDAPHNHQIDIWPDPVSHDAWPQQRVDDYVTGLAVAPDGTVWASARDRQDNPNQYQVMGIGLAHLSATGVPIGYLTDAMPSQHLTALAADPDGSIWIGSEAGVARYIPSQGVVQQFGGDALGGHWGDIVGNIQIDTSGPKRRVLIGFMSGAVAIYTGD